VPQNKRLVALRITFNLSAGFEDIDCVSLSGPRCPASTSTRTRQASFSFTRQTPAPLTVPSRWPAPPLPAAGASPPGGRCLPSRILAPPGFTSRPNLRHLGEPDLFPSRRADGGRDVGGGGERGQRDPIYSHGYVATDYTCVVAFVLSQRKNK
jgi:hypothetical protein